MALVEMSVVEQRYRPILAVAQVSPKSWWRPSFGVSRKPCTRG